MPSRRHEGLLRGVTTQIVLQLSTIASGQGPSADFARDIQDHGSETIKFDETEYGQHDPDASFGHSNSHYPGIVIEESYSQKRKDLPYLADDYILGSDGNIGVVIGLDIEYLGKTAATLSIWRPKFLIDDGEKILQVEQTVTDQVRLSTRFTPIYLQN
jgi:hypothetical protein